MAFLTEPKFKRELLKVLYPDNSFFTKGKMDFNQDDAKTIKYPVATEIDGAKTGSPSLPLSITNYEDGEAEYSTAQIYGGPILVKNEDEMLTNYSIFQDRVQQIAAVINTKIANLAAYQWGPTKAARIALTTGTDSRTTSLTGSATGSRKKVIKDDILKAYTVLKKDNMPGGNAVYALCTPDYYQDLLEISDFIDYEKTGQKDKLARGIVGRLMGIEFIQRWDENTGSAGLWYSQSKSKKDNTAAAAANDGAAMLLFKAGAVRYSRSKVGVWIDRGKPEYLGGTLLSSATRFGGTIYRQDDEKGTYAIVEATT